MDYSEIRREARESLRGNVLTCFGAGFVLWLIMCVAGFTVIGSLILAGPVALGVSMLAMQVSRTNKGEFGTAFKGFNRLGDAFVACFLTGLFIFLWALLGLISYGIAIATSISTGEMNFVALFLTFPLMIPAVICGYRYSMVYFILNDNPEMSGTEAMKASKEMMKGHKWELFVLHLTFIGWIILSPFTLYLLLIWLIPYMRISQVKFYERIKSAQTTAA